MPVKFEWDEAKNAANKRKHGISFEEAALIFSGPMLTEHDDRFNYGEIRERAFGMLAPGQVLHIIYAESSQIIRIISARKATRAERNRFDAHLKRTLGGNRRHQG